MTDKQIRKEMLTVIDIAITTAPAIHTPGLFKTEHSFNRAPVKRHTAWLRYARFQELMLRDAQKITLQAGPLKFTVFNNRPTLEALRKRVSAWR